MFGLHYIRGFAQDSDGFDDRKFWDSFVYLFQLTVGAGDLAMEDDGESVTAQVFTIIFVIFSAILMMNLLIALMTTTYEQMRKSGKNESSAAFAVITYDLAHQSRFMPAPIGLYVLMAALIVHIINFIPAMIDPSCLNIYLLVNHYQYTGLVSWKWSYCCFQCREKKDIDDGELSDEKKKEMYQKRRCLNCFEVGVCRPRQYCRQKLQQHCDCCCVEEVELFTKEAANAKIQNKKCCCCTPKKPCCVRKCGSCYSHIRDRTCCESNSSEKQDGPVYKLSSRGRVYVELFVE